MGRYYPGVVKVQELSFSIRQQDGARNEFPAVWQFDIQQIGAGGQSRQSNEAETVRSLALRDAASANLNYCGGKYLGLNRINNASD